MNEIVIPLIWAINLNDLSLPFLTVVVWTLDWFNPCALWILLFLLSMLIGSWNKKKLIIIWWTFILASWITYFAFMTAWLNFMMFMWFTIWLRVLVWIVWIWFWIHAIKDFYNKHTWCEVVWWKRRDYFFAKIKKVIDSNSTIIAIVWISIVAFSVNLLELLCSAWFPATYTAILADNHLPTYQYYLYLLWYIFFFLLDQIIIFAIAVFAFKITAISNKYTKWINLIWGLVMLGLGWYMIGNVILKMM